ncbi:hypothetical protein [Paenibacillus sp. FSL H8-0332]|uniref:Uncharacterized protein n=1 Tax=Paenibacillus rhizoplanae TaxID=1917181 RepID=A0ABW5FID1_9BACL
MALFFAQRVTLGKTKYSEVPSTLKPAVKQILVENGLTFLVTEE